MRCRACPVLARVAGGFREPSAMTLTDRLPMAKQQVTIYHNPRCNTSRTVLKMLQDQGIEPEVVLYLENPPSEKELLDVLTMAGMRPTDLVRRKEPIAKELG